MKDLERFSLHVSAVLMGVSGLLYGWLKYFHQRAGDFGPEPFALQGWAQHAHVVTGPVLVFTLGMLMRGHVLPALRYGARRGRATGLLLVAILGPMILAGYGMQICVDPGLRRVFAWIHGPSALLFLLGYGVHVLRPRSRTATAACAGLGVS